METLPIIAEIEALLKLNLYPARVRGNDPVSGVMPVLDKQPCRYALRNGALAGLNLAGAKLTDEQWQQICAMDGFQADRMEALNLRNNRLSAPPIPEQMTQLRHLDLCDNQLREFRLPAAGRLEHIWLYGNNGLESPAPELVRQGNRALVNYFRERDQQGTEQIFEAKLLLVGEGGAGKTSLYRRLCHPGLPLPGVDDTTRGIDIHEYHFKTPDGKDFRLNVWDFGGQEIYHATHQFFLTKRSLYILVDDTRSNNKTVQDEGFKYWLEVIETLSDKSPVLIFQNEKSGRSKAIDLAGIKGRFDNVEKLYQGNLQSPDSITEIRDAIPFFAKGLPHIGEALPKKWVSIREALEKAAKSAPYMTQKEYLDLYARYLPADRQKALLLSRYLHDLGVFLHFQEDRLLSQTVILQNAWATEAVFKILDDETVKGQLGRFSEADCTRLWSESEYADMHAQLLALMGKFELCYQLPGVHPDTWLAPQLLPASKPEALQHWDAPSDLVVRYEYTFLPKGMVSRLMVRQHRFVQNTALAWRNGVLFEHAGAQVLVEAPYAESTIVFRARGAGPKELLTVLSNDLDALNESFEGLRGKVAKKIPCNCSSCLVLTVPYFYDYNKLKEMKSFGKKSIGCGNRPYKEVPIQGLLDGVSSAKSIEGMLAGAHSPANLDELHRLISDGELKKALRQMIPDFPEARALLGRLNEVDQEFNRQKIDFETKALSTNRIRDAVLALLDKE